MAEEENVKNYFLIKNLKSISVMLNRLGEMHGAGDQTGYFLANNQFSSLQSCQLLLGTPCLVLCSADCFLHTLAISLCAWR